MNPVARLTAREREVLRLRARGLGAGEIARELGISRETARKHLDNAVRATGTGDVVVACILLVEADRTATP